jgi:putative hemolysin
VNPDWPLGLTLTSLFILLSLAVLAASETALNQVGIHRVRKMLESKGGDEQSELEDQASVLTTLHVTRLVMLLVTGGFGEAMLENLAVTAQMHVLAVLATVLLLLLVEVLARQLAITYSWTVVQYTLPLGLLVSKFMSPLVSTLLAVARAVLPKTTDRRVGPLGLSLENINAEVRHLKLQGVLEQDQDEIIRSVFTFNDTIAREVMVPRVDMLCVELGTHFKEVMEIMLKSGYSRLPVYEDSVDNVLGVVHSKDLLQRLGRVELSVLQDVPIGRQHLRDVLIVPGTKKIARILRELQSKKIAMAIVVDEYGGTDGLLTLEDIVEEIVGEITDEYDQASEGVQPQKDGSAIVDAKIVIEDVNEFLKLDLPYDEHETLGGYIYGLLGKVPQPGETVSVDNLEFTIEGIHRRRITRVRIRNLEQVVEETPLPATAVPA